MSRGEHLPRGRLLHTYRMKAMGRRVNAGNDESRLDRAAVTDSDAAVSVVFPEVRLVARMICSAGVSAQQDYDQPERGHTITVNPVTNLHEDGSLEAVDDGASSPTLLLRAVQVATAGLAAMGGPAAVAFWMDISGLEDPNALMILQGGLFSLAILSTVPLLGSMHEALRPGGALERLGAGVRKISEQESRAQHRWRVGLSVFGVLFALGYVVFGMFVLSRATKPLTIALGVAIASVLPTATCLVVFGLWPSLRLGSVLTRDAVMDVIKSIVSTDIGDEAEWDAKVTQQALFLERALGDLAVGWGLSLEAATMVCWWGCLAWLTLATNTPLCEAMEARVQAGELADLNGPLTHECTFLRTIGVIGSTLFALAPLALTYALTCSN